MATRAARDETSQHPTDRPGGACGGSGGAAPPDRDPPGLPPRTAVRGRNGGTAALHATTAMPA